MKRIAWIGLAVLLTVPLAAWLFYKPIRALAPQLVGLTCVRKNICVDDSARASEATALYDDALQFVNAHVDDIRRPPWAVFCSTTSCFETFGLEKPAAHTTPFGVIIGPRGWEPHYVRHEMIHHLQMERLGFWKLGPIRRWRSPDWFIEGMAYVLSEDPRFTLNEPYQTYRLRFKEWYQSVPKERLWELAREL